MSNSVSHACLPYPIKNARFSLALSFRTSAGTPTDPTTPDTEFSTDGGATFTDCAEEITTGGSNGMGYLTLTGSETNNSLLLIAAKSANCLETPAVLYPRQLAIVSSGTLSAGSAGGGTLGTILGYDVTGCFLRTTGGTGGGGTGGANNQARMLATYNTSTGVFTVIPNWETTPDATTTYDLLLPEGETLGAIKSLNPTTPGNALAVDSSGRVDLGKALGTAITLDSNNVLNVSTKYVGGTLQTARDIGLSVLLSSGTGTGQLDFTGGIVKSDMRKAVGTTITETVAGQIAAALVALASTFGTATAGGASTLTLQTATTANLFRRNAISIYDGTGAGQTMNITSNTTTVVTVDQPWTVQPDNTSKYVIWATDNPATDQSGQVLAVLANAAHGGSSASLSLSNMAINNSGGDALTVRSIGGGGRGIVIGGNSGADGVIVSGGINAVLATATNLTNAPTSGDFTATMKTSLNAATPASVTGAVGSVTGAVGSVTGNVGGNVAGSVGSISGITFPTNFSTISIDSSGRLLLQPSQSGVTIGHVTTVDGNVVGSVGSVTGAVGSVTGAVGSVTGAVGGNVSGSVVGDVDGKILGGGASSITGDGVRASSVTGSVGSVAGSVGSVTGSVGSVAGSVAGDVAGKVLGGGASSISGAGVRADSVTGAVGSVTGAVGSVTSNVNTNANSTETAIKTKTDQMTFTVPLHIDATASVGGNVTVGGYASGQDPATLLFVDGSTNKLKVNSDNSVNVSSGIIVSVVVPPSVATASQEPDVITVLRGDTLNRTIFMGDITGRLALWFTVKTDTLLLDTDSTLQITEDGGLVVLNGSTAVTSTDAALIVVDEVTGEVLIRGTSEIMALLEPNSYVWDAQYTSAGGEDITPKSGDFNVVGDVTRAT